MFVLLQSYFLNSLLIFDAVTGSLLAAFPNYFESLSKPCLLLLLQVKRKQQV